MKSRQLYLSIIILTILLLGACQKNENITNITNKNGEFITTIESRYSLDLTTRSTKTPINHTSYNGILEVSVTECNWDQPTLNTKGNITGEEVQWEDEPRVALYVTNSDDNLKIKNVAINPLNHLIYKSYAYSFAETPNIIAEEEATITTTSFFWNKWSKKEDMPDIANFYGYYPRPYDVYDSRDWEYSKNSVIDYKSIINSSLPWYLLKYEFATETDETMNQFDLMYSVSETSSDDNSSNRYGNKMKKEGESIHMPFQHVFSLLDIEIDKGNYAGDFIVSEIRISGSEISETGQFNLKTGEITKGTGNGTITKTIEKYTEANDIFTTTMIVPPTTDDISESTSTSDDRLLLTCKIDNAEYKCSFPYMILKSGKKYKVKLAFQSDKIVFMQVWNGASVSLGNNNYTKENEVSYSDLKETSFKVNINEGYNLSKVLKNGKVMTANSDGTYDFDPASEGKTYYTVVTYPDNWYITESMRIHFDGIFNNPYTIQQDENRTIWSDLTGNGHDGELKNFSAPTSGWKNSGLYFDGADDIVTFPGDINATEYTMEFYICFDEPQNMGGTPRIIAEGTDYPAYYFRKTWNYSDSKEWRIGLYGHGPGNVHDFYTKTLLLGQKMQIDCVYKDKTINIYLNGEFFESVNNLAEDAKSIPIASLGRRITDGTRAATGYYYSFILYDKALSSDHINNNYNVNKERYNL